MSLESPVVREGWDVGRIGDLFDSWGGHTPSKANSVYWGGSILWVSSRDVKDARLGTSTHTITEQAIKETGLKVCPAGSVLVVMRSGILAHSLPVTVTQIPVTINQDLKAFHSPTPYMNEWLALFLRSNADELLASSRRDGTTVQSVQYPLLKNTLLPFPDADGRRRLLDAAETVAKRKEAAQQQLATARQAVEQFRKSVLAAACSGRLTADWRRSHPLSSALMPASKSRTRRTTENAPDLLLPELPDSYQITTVGDVAVVLDYGTSQRADSSADDGLPVLRMGNIQDGALDLGDLKYCHRDAQIDALLLVDGDLLFNRTNSPELVGKSAVFRGDQEMTFASYLIRVRVDPEYAVPEFVNYWLNSAWGRLWAYQVKTDGVSQSNINGSKLAAMPLPLPPVDEQRLIVQRASQMLGTSSRVIGLAAVVGHQLSQASRDLIGAALDGEAGLEAAEV